MFGLGKKKHLWHKSGNAGGPRPSLRSGTSCMDPRWTWSSNQGNTKTWIRWACCPRTPAGFQRPGTTGTKSPGNKSTNDECVEDSWTSAGKSPRPAPETCPSCPTFRNQRENRCSPGREDLGTSNARPKQRYANATSTLEMSPALQERQNWAVGCAAQTRCSLTSGSGASCRPHIPQILRVPPPPPQPAKYRTGTEIPFGAAAPASGLMGGAAASLSPVPPPAQIYGPLRQRGRPFFSFPDSESSGPGARTAGSILQRRPGPEWASLSVTLLRVSLHPRRRGTRPPRPPQGN